MATHYISYSRVDAWFLDEILRRLREAFPQDAFYYDTKRSGGDDWWSVVLEQIAACDVFVYLLTADSLNAPYCQGEYAEAQRLQKPVLLVQMRERTLVPAARRDQPIIRILSPDDERGFAALVSALEDLRAWGNTHPFPLSATPTPVPEIIEQSILPSPRPYIIAVLLITLSMIIFVLLMVGSVLSEISSDMIATDLPATPTVIPIAPDS